MMLLPKALNGYGNSTATKATYKDHLLESILLLQYIIENLTRICNNLQPLITIIIIFPFMQGGMNNDHSFCLPVKTLSQQGANLTEGDDNLLRLLLITSHKNLACT